MGPATILDNAANLCHRWEKVELHGRARSTFYSLRQCPPRRRPGPPVQLRVYLMPLSGRIVRLYYAPKKYVVGLQTMCQDILLL
jgi:hypothetical protein